MQTAWLHRYLLPGFIFQSVIVSGGYGTGQELVQFFLILGPIDGLLGLCMAAGIWSVVSVLCYEFARVFQAYDYRVFFQNLLGKVWILFEVIYLLVIVLVLSVIAASAGSIGKDLLGIPYNAGLFCMMLYISFLVLRGSRTIEKMLSIWSILLYCVFVAFFVSCFLAFPTEITTQLQTNMGSFEWVKNGLKYASYNLGLIPAVFFALRHLKTRKEAVISGLLTGPIAVFPGILFFLCMLSHYPSVTQEVVPSTYLLHILGLPLLTSAFSLVLLGTLIETAVGLIHALNQRIASQYESINRTMPSFYRSVIAIVALGCSVLFAQFGLIELISKGYGMLTWVILTIFILPLVVFWLNRFFARVRA